MYDRKGLLGVLGHVQSMSVDLCIQSIKLEPRLRLT